VTSKTTQLSRMKGDWERRASANPMYHIDARRTQWNRDEFYEGGEAIVAAAIDPVMARFGVDPSALDLLEIGPGMGRLFPGLTKRFRSVTGVEISQKMIELGQQHCPARDSARWIAGDGRSLTGVPDASIDVVVSFEVFQHIPTYEPITSYLTEARRVLRSGGVLNVQLRKGSDSSAQAAFRRLPRAMQPSAAFVLKKTRVMPITGHVDTWLGCIVEPSAALARAESLGFRDTCVLPDNLHAPGMGYWLAARVP
jgi:SAM-dependent methyltransferase